jgi:hypothetical protein
MTLRQLTIVPMLALSLFAVGCGADCESTCEDLKECDNADDETKKTDCAKTCEDQAKDCEDQSDDLVSCVNDLDDICKWDPSKDCTSELTKLGECMNK